MLQRFVYEDGRLFYFCSIRPYVEIHPEGYADLKKLLDRGLNTWDDAPPWLVKLSDHLERELQKGA